LLDAGREEDAYQLALGAYQKTTNLATYRAIKKQYPNKSPKDILDNLIERSDDKGKWFATAKEIKEAQMGASTC